MELEAEPLPEPPVQAASPEPTVPPPEETVSLEKKVRHEGERNARASGVLCAVEC